MVVSLFNLVPEEIIGNQEGINCLAFVCFENVFQAIEGTAWLCL